MQTMINKKTNMKKLIRRIVLSVAVMLSLAGCRDDMPEMHNPMTNVNIYNWSQLFDAYWSGMNYNYTFWDIDSTDWDAVYAEYKPKFDAIADKGFNDKSTNDSAFNMIKRMSANLIDGHFYVMIPFSDTTYIFQPSSEKIINRPGYHNSYNIGGYLTALNKMRTDLRLTNDTIMRYTDESDGTQVWGAAGVIDGDIIYLRFSNFFFSQYLGSDNPVDRLYRRYDDMIDNYPNVKGVIIDVRGNGGGYLADMLLILGKLAEERTLMFYTRMKNGTGRLDYTPWTPEYLDPVERKRSLDVPVVALADLYSVSMGEMMPMAVRTLPKGIVIGERTYGGTGQLESDNSAFEKYYGGYFAIGGKITVYTTMTMTKDVNGVNHEGIGLTPDIEVPYDEETIESGIDNQLERAVEYIHTGR